MTIMLCVRVVRLGVRRGVIGGGEKDACALEEFDSSEGAKQHGPKYASDKVTNTLIMVHKYIITSGSRLDNPGRGQQRQLGAQSIKV